MIIWKYEIPIRDLFEIEMPETSAVLCVQMQKETPCIWVGVYGNPDNLIRKSFAIVGTGQFFNDSEYLYIGTFQQYEGALIWHLFEWMYQC
jgi:hypothetical protein